MGRPPVDQPRTADASKACERLAPEKDGASIEAAMGQMRERIDEAQGRAPPVLAGRAEHAGDRRGRRRPPTRTCCAPARRSMAPMISSGSITPAFSPIPDASAHPAAEVAAACSARTGSTRPIGCCAITASPSTRSRPERENGMLDLDIDPKLAWALKHRDRFPVDVNMAEAARCCCACRASARARSTRSSRRAGTATLRLDDVARLTSGPEAGAPVPDRGGPPPDAADRPPRSAPAARRTSPSS